MYETDNAAGDGWSLMLGDSCERLAEIHANSIDLTIESPPFASLFTYSPLDRDLGNSVSRAEFLDHYGFVIREALRVLKPGRLRCVHVQQVVRLKSVEGVVGLTDFRGEVIAAHEAAGWIFHGEVTIDKCPQVQALRTKAQALMFTTLERDSSKSRPALADYLLIFRKPGDNEVPVKPEVTRDEWITWARPLWSADPDDAIADTEALIGCWYGIRETDTLNEAVAREDADERHICPLQLPLIERCVRLWSNPGETVLSPFAGIGSEGVVALQRGRRFVGCELKRSYWQTAVANLQRVEQQMASRLDLKAVTA